MSDRPRILLCFLGLIAVAGRAPAESARLFGFDAMHHLEQLPLLFPNGTQTRQPLAYDASGGNYDHHFLASFSKYSETRTRADGQVETEYVIFDEYGPGCLYRQQMNAWFDRSGLKDAWLPLGSLTQPRANANIRFYFDDESHPRIDLPLSDFFSTKVAPFNPPLCYIDRANLFANSYYPFRFQGRLKITLRPNAESFVTLDTKWYQDTALVFPVGTAVGTWEENRDDDPVVRERWLHPGRNPHDLPGSRQDRQISAIKAGETRTLWELHEPGTIVGLRLVLQPYTVDTFFNSRIRIYWDGQARPAVDLPLAYLFGAGGMDYPDTREKVFAKSLRTLLFGFSPEDGSLYSYWPMPFWQSVRIEVENQSGRDLAGLACEVTYVPAAALSYPREQTGYFHARRTTDGDPDTLGYRGVALAETGRGHVVGLTFYSDRYDMDGDEFTYIDDSQTPQIHGSGTEDDHNQGWAGRDEQRPLWGGLFNGYHGAYRLYLNDCYVFNRDILISYEYSLMKKEKFVNGGRTDVTTFYYLAAGGPNLRLTDELDVADHYSETQHRYSVTGQTWQGRLRDEYDGYERDQRHGSCTDDGRAFHGASRFTVAIDPDNQGVKLRRRLNRRDNGVQTAEVWVDGKKVGRPWHVVTQSVSPAPTERDFDGWFDSDFELPADLTHGKPEITVEIRYLASPLKAEINEFHYWIYSYR